MKMGAFLSVARGSKEEPRLIVLRYYGGKADEAPIALVGKSVMFDSGGYSLKSRMATMHDDMAAEPPWRERSGPSPRKSFR